MSTTTIHFNNIGFVHFNFDASKAETIDTLLGYCYKNKLALKLLENLAAKYQFINIDFVAEYLPFNGHYDYERQRIRIKDHLSVNELLETLMFECCNALNSSFDHIRLDAFEHPHQYADHMEKAEHESFLLACQIYQYGILHANWPLPKNVEQYNDLITKEGWFERAHQKTNTNKNKNFHSHYEYYTNFFNRHKIHHTDSKQKIDFSIR